MQATERPCRCAFKCGALFTKLMVIRLNKMTSDKITALECHCSTGISVSCLVRHRRKIVRNPMDLTIDLRTDWPCMWKLR